MNKNIINVAILALVGMVQLALTGYMAWVAPASAPVYQDMASMALGLLLLSGGVISGLAAWYLAFDLYTDGKAKATCLGCGQLHARKGTVFCSDACEDLTRAGELEDWAAEQEIQDAAWLADEAELDALELALEARYATELAEDILAAEEAAHDAWLDSQPEEEFVLYFSIHQDVEDLGAQPDSGLGWVAVPYTGN